MRRLAVLASAAVLTLALGCSSNPRTWHPSRFSPPNGVAATVWDACWQLAEKEAMKLESYRNMTPDQKKCTMLHATADCIRDMKQTLKEGNPEVYARCDWRTFETMVEDTDVEQCSDPDEGESDVVRDVIRYLAGQGRGSPSSFNRDGEACPAR